MKNLAYKVLFGICCIIFSENVFPEDVNILFDYGNKFYQEKEYGNAIAMYDSVVKSGYESEELYFNLGNAHFKNGENTKAILYYERAKKLNPNDEDSEFNLRLANLKVAGKTETLPELFFVKWWNNLVDTYSSEQWGIYLAVALWIAFGIGVTFIFTYNFSLKRFAFFIAVFFLLVAVLISFFAYSQYLNEIKKSAVVFSPNSYIKSAPDEKAVDLFILHEGVKVELKDKLGEWNKIKLADGKEGWIQSEAMEII